MTPSEKEALIREIESYESPFYEGYILKDTVISIIKNAPLDTQENDNGDSD